MQRRAVVLILLVKFKLQTRRHLQDSRVARVTCMSKRLRKSSAHTVARHAGCRVVGLKAPGGQRGRGRGGGGGGGAGGAEGLGAVN